jgi:hypothetical protein
VSAALKGKKAASKKAAPRKAATKKAPMTKAAPKNVAARKRGPEKASVKKAAPKKVAPKKQAAVPKPRQVENLIAGAEVPRKFTMTLQVSGREFLDDPVAATRRVLVVALSQIPAKIHEELVDNESINKGMFNKRAEIHFIGVLNDPKNPARAGVVDSPNLWEWRPAER